MSSQCVWVIAISLVSLGCSGGTSVAPTGETHTLNPASALVVKTFAEESPGLPVEPERGAEELPKKDEKPAPENSCAADGKGDFRNWRWPSALDDAGAKCLADLKYRGRILNIQCSPLTDQGLLSLASLPELTVLLLGSSDVTPEGLAEFRRRRPNCVVRTLTRTGYYMPQSKYLNFGLGTEQLHHVGVIIGHPFTDADIAAISGYDEVEFVDVGINQTRFSPRGITDGCNLSNDSMRILSRLPRLVHLELSLGHDITDEGLMLFLGHPTLKSILLIETSVTDAGYEHFLKESPNLEHSGFEKEIPWRDE